MSSHYYTRPRRRGGRILISAFIRGVTVEFYTSPSVFSAKQVDEGTRLLIEHARVPEEGTILDMGAGYGAIGITLAKAYPRLRVVMVELNPHAAALARQNAKLNQVEDRVEVLAGNLYEPVKGRKFDAILSNPPLAAGMDTVLEIVRQAPEHLEPHGTLQMVLRKGAEKVLEEMKARFNTVEVLLRKKGYTILAAAEPHQER